MGYNMVDAYFDRNQAALALCALLRKLEITVGWKDDGDYVDYVIMFADLPTGQVSWHIPRTEIRLEDWPRYEGLWDFHVTSQKRDRLYEFMQQTLAL